MPCPPNYDGATGSAGPKGATLDTSTLAGKASGRPMVDRPFITTIQASYPEDDTTSGMAVI